MWLKQILEDSILRNFPDPLTHKECIFFWFYDPSFSFVQPDNAKPVEKQNDEIDRVDLISFHSEINTWRKFMVIVMISFS